MSATIVKKIAVISAGLSQPSSTRLLADRLAAATDRLLEADETVRVEVDFIELRDHAHDLTNQLLTGFPSTSLRTAIESVTSADGVIAVSPIFSASYSGLFKTFFDVLEMDSLAGTPVLIAATGGTARHSLALEFALRPLFSYLRATVAPTAVFAATDDWGTSTDGHLHARIERAAGELAELIMNRTAGGQVDPYDSPVPFEQMLFNGERDI